MNGELEVPILNTTVAILNHELLIETRITEIFGRYFNNKATYSVLCFYRNILSNSSLQEDRTVPQSLAPPGGHRLILQAVVSPRLFQGG